MTGDPDWLAAARANGLIVGETVARPPVELGPAPVPAGRKRGRRTAPIATAAPARLVVECDVPVRLVSEANVGGRLRGKVGRKSAVKAAVAAALPRLSADARFPLPAVVTLTRCGAAELDDDNLRAAFKAARDVIAEWLGVDDRDRRVTWRYRQRAAWVPFARIRITHAGG